MYFLAHSVGIVYINLFINFIYAEIIDPKGRQYTLLTIVFYLQTKYEFSLHYKVNGLHEVGTPFKM